jgi:hypothetical protein
MLEAERVGLLRHWSSRHGKNRGAMSAFGDAKTNKDGGPGVRLKK